MDKSVRQKYPASALSILILAGAVLRLLFLRGRSLWFDEGTTLMLSRVPLSALFDFVVRDEVMPPLYHFLMHGWLRLFVDPLLGMRLFSALCGIAALFAFRRLAERLLPERARLLAVFLAAFSSYWIHLAQDGRVYALLTLVSVLITTDVFDLSERPSPRLWAQYAALAACGLWMHYYFAVLLATHAAWLVFRWRHSRRELMFLVAAHAAAGLLFLPWAGAFLRQFPLHRHIIANGDALTLRHTLGLYGTMFFDPSFLGLILPAWIAPAAGGAFAVIATAAVRGGSDRERRAAVFCLAHIGIPLVMIALVEAWCGRPVTQSRFFAPLSPFVYLLTALILAAPGARRRVLRLACTALVAAGAACWFASGRNIDPRLGALADAIRASTEPSLPLVYLETYYYLPMRAYYLPERRHYLVARSAEGMDYSGYPPYDGVLDDARLTALGPCLVMDENRRLGGALRWIGDGAQVAALMRR